MQQEVTQHRKVGKKYQKVKTILHYTAVGAGTLSGALSAAAVASAASVIGIPLSVATGATAATLGVTSAVLTGVCKKLDPKVSKHREIVALAIAKHETVNRLVSKALTDNRISDPEFQLIMNELDSYFALKEAVRRRLGAPIEKNISHVPTPAPDLVKIREQIRKEEKEKLKKRLSAVSSSDLKG